MAWTAGSGLFLFPTPNLDNYVPQWSTRTIDAATEKFAMIIRVPKTGNIRKIIFGVNTSGGTGTFNGRIETVDDTTGAPTGTAYGGMVEGTVAAGGGTKTITLSTDAAATAGDIVAVVIGYSSWTSAVMGIKYDGTATPNFPYTIHYTGSWSKFGPPMLVLGYDDGSHPPMIGVDVVMDYFETDFTNATSIKEVAWSYAMPVITKIYGFVAPYGPVAAGADFDFVIYDASNNVILSQTYDYNIGQSASRRFMWFDLPTPLEVAANTTYYFAMKPTTTNIVRSNYSVAILSAAGSVNHQRGAGTVNYVTRTTAVTGAWSSVADAMGGHFLIDTLEYMTAAAGGLITHPGMAGGMRG